jgi:O-antigen/teichoic acid export membrane protein
MQREGRVSGSILRNVSRGSFFLAAEQLSGLVAGLLYSVIVLRWLGPWTYGMLSLALAIVGLGSVATGNFEVFLERYAAEYETRGQMALLARAHLLTAALKVGLGVVACAVLIGISGWLGQRYHAPIMPQVLCVLAGLAVCEGFSVTGRAVLFGLQRFGWMAAIAVVVQAIKIVAVTLLWLKGQGLILLAALLLGLGAGQGAFLTVLAIVLVRRGRAAVGESVPPALLALGTSEEESPGPAAGAAATAAAPPGRSLLGSILRYCLPLLGARAAFLSGQNLSRVVLGAFMSLEQLGYYSFAFTLVDRFVSFVYALPSSLLPSFTQLLARGERPRFTRLFDKAFRLVATAAALLSAGLLLFAYELTRVGGGKQYLPAVAVLAVLGLVPWARTAQQPLTMAFYALRHTGRVLFLALVKLGVEIGAYFLLIPVLGMMGAAWATLAGATVAFALALALLGRELVPSRHRWMVMAKTSTLIALAIAGSAALSAAGATGWVSLALKLALYGPGLLTAVFLFDLVTEDDLTRAADLELRSAWSRGARDRAVALGRRLSRAARRLRPGRLATAEGN